MPNQKYELGVYYLIIYYKMRMLFILKQKLRQLGYADMVKIVEF